MFQRPGPFSFGASSTRELDTLKEPLERVLTRAIEIFDFSITEGSRTIETQIRNLRKGVSKTIDSRHIPRDEEGEYVSEGLGEAADLVPFQAGVNPWPQPADSPETREKKLRRFYFMQGILYAVAAEVGTNVRMGVDWDGDLDFFDQTFDDLGHIELRTARAALKIPPELLDEVNQALRSRGLTEVTAA